MTTVLTGVQATGQPHIGNYLGAMRPALAQAAKADTTTYFFIADYHALTSVVDPKNLQIWLHEVAASWLACGLDPQTTIFYRQSLIPEIFELNWILACLSPKGLMNRAHAYKAKVQENIEAGREDQDAGVNMGLFTYPLLMSADILALDADLVPVGEDQLQHIEIARDLAQKCNHLYGKNKELLRVPKPLISKNQKLVPGLDGRKMSKSYGNHIPLFLDEKKLRALIMKIKTDSLPPEAPKATEGSLLFDLYKEFATPEETQSMAARYAAGTGWGHVKEALFEVINREIASKRERYLALMADTKQIDQLLVAGSEQARKRARTVLDRVRQAIGVG
jgi:tryptophanyl-tRNA synthetase